MRVLCLNCGSSSLKFDILELKSALDDPRPIASGSVERIGGQAGLHLQHDGHNDRRDIEAPDYSAALSESLRSLHEVGLLQDLDAVAHRVVHGGPHLLESAVIDNNVLQAIEAATELAPLHNGPALATIRSAREQFSAGMPMTASFDTTFFAGLPDVACEYALPIDLRRRHAIRRYGFHGLAHRYMAEHLSRIRPDLRDAKLVTLQLGSGSSAAAIEGSKPVDTSMGFSPLEGLIMGTRSGDLDPMLPLFISQHEDMSTSEVETLLNKRSGLFGLSGISGDMQELLNAADVGDPKADLSVRAYCYHVRKYIGSYAAALSGLDAIVFGGGIGENSARIRQTICEGFGWLGLRMDDAANQTPGVAGLISSAESRVAAYVVSVNEANVMVRDAFSCLTS